MSCQTTGLRRQLSHAVRQGARGREPRAAAQPGGVTHADAMRRARVAEDAQELADRYGFSPAELP